MRKLKTLFTLLVMSMCTAAWAQEELAVTVSLREPGGLATEIRAYPGVEHEKYVTSLTVTSGELNADDWATLKLMDALVTLDLSATSNKEIPAYQFYKCCANLQTIAMPNQLETIGISAFGGKGKLVSAILPTTLKSIGESAFSGCNVLETVGSTWPSGVTIIPDDCFSGCNKLTSFTIPEGVTYIGGQAFNGCQLFTSTLPSTLTHIGGYAFWSANMQDIDVILPEDSEIDHFAFSGTEIKSITLPSKYYSAYTISYVCPSSSSLTDVTIKSPTVMKSGGYLGLNKNTNLVIHVPDYLVNAYKSDSYWYDFSSKIQGFDITQIDIVWPFQTSFHLNGYTRMAGEPKVSFADGNNLTISGDDSQKFGEFTLFGPGDEHYNGEFYYWPQILSTCNNVTVTGDYMQKIRTSLNSWYYICLPFDVDVSAIECESKFAVRYYDGESRAYNNVASGNWKNYEAGDVIPAGTGFIYQTSQTAWTTFKAVHNDSRNNVFKNEEIITPLAANNTTAEGNNLLAANKGWNMVGNPWQCYFNIHKLNYAAPISIREGSTYTAYSIQDDDYALRPNQAFFVQCPDAVTSIGFPTDGRQLTKEITSVQGARRLGAAEKTRWLVDVQITGSEEQKDKTRLVVNNQAEMDFEMTRDATKLMSLEGTVPQIYSMDGDDNQYAINERPFDNGQLRLGLIIKEDGQYTIQAVRNDMGRVLLKDDETGITTDLSQNGYSFSAKAGTNESRFTLSFTDSEATGIRTIDNTKKTAGSFYNLNGQRVKATSKGIYVAGGKKVLVK